MIVTFSNKYIINSKKKIAKNVYFRYKIYGHGGR